MIRFIVGFGIGVIAGYLATMMAALHQFSHEPKSYQPRIGL